VSSSKVPILRKKIYSETHACAKNEQGRCQERNTLRPRAPQPREEDGVPCPRACAVFIRRCCVTHICARWLSSLFKNRSPRLRGSRSLRTCPCQGMPERCWLVVGYARFLDHDCAKSHRALETAPSLMPRSRRYVPTIWARAISKLASGRGLAALANFSATYPDSLLIRMRASAMPML